MQPSTPRLHCRSPARRTSPHRRTLRLRSARPELPAYPQKVEGQRSRGEAGRPLSTSRLPRHLLMPGQHSLDRPSPRTPPHRRNRSRLISLRARHYRRTPEKAAPQGDFSAPGLSRHCRPRRTRRSYSRPQRSPLSPRPPRQRPCPPPPKLPLCPAAPV